MISEEELRCSESGQALLQRVDASDVSVFCFAPSSAALDELHAARQLRELEVFASLAQIHRAPDRPVLRGERSGSRHPQRVPVEDTQSGHQQHHI